MRKGGARLGDTEQGGALTDRGDSSIVWRRRPQVNSVEEVLWHRDVWQGLPVDWCHASREISGRGKVHTCIEQEEDVVLCVGKRGTGGHSDMC